MELRNNDHRYSLPSHRCCTYSLQKTDPHKAAGGFDEGFHPSGGPGKVFFPHSSFAYIPSTKRHPSGILQIEILLQYIYK